MTKKGLKMKKPVNTYETKYPVNKQKCEYYAVCEFLNTQNPDITVCWADHNVHKPGSSW